MFFDSLPMSKITSSVQNFDLKDGFGYESLNHAAEEALQSLYDNTRKKNPVHPYYGIRSVKTIIIIVLAQKIYSSLTRELQF